MSGIPSIYCCAFKGCTGSVVPPDRECVKHSSPEYYEAREAARQQAVDWWRDLCNMPPKSRGPV